MSSLDYYIEKLTKDLEANSHKIMSDKKERISKVQIKLNLHNEINSYFNNKGYKLLIDLDNITAKNQPLHYICCCGTEKHKAFKEILTRNCRQCKDSLLKDIPNDISICPSDVHNELWKPVEGGFISSKGRACNSYGKLLTIDEKGRYFLAGKMHYSTILMAKVFNIDNVNKLNGSTSNYIVRNTSDNLVATLDDIYVGTRSEIGKIYGKKSKKSEEFKQNMSMDVIKHIENYKYKTIPEFSTHLIFEDGNIYNNDYGSGCKKFLTFSKHISKHHKTYYSLCTNDKTYKVHRLVCYAFHPIEGKTSLIDYNDLQVNHIDGNTLNNHKDNLEWATKSQNIQHAYDTGLNKKLRAIIQYDLENNFIAEFESIAKAARETNVQEHQIREVAKGRTKPSQYIWKYKDESKNEEFSKKYASKVNKKQIEELEIIFEE
jgi:hypothetical protein